MPMTDNEPKLPDEQSVYERQLRWTREEERHEIGWISQRLSWLLISQSFLITTSIIVQSKDYEWWFGFIASNILGILGIWINLRGMLAIHAAQIIINKGWLVKANMLITSAQGKLEPYCINRVLHKNNKSPEDDYIHREAIKLHLHIGKIFIYSWVFIYILSFITSFTREFSIYTIPVFSTGWWFIHAGVIWFFLLSIVFYTRFSRCFEQLNLTAKDLECQRDSSDCRIEKSDTV